MAYFNDPKVRIQEALDDLREDIGKREKEVRGLKKDISDLERKKELLEGELEELYTNEKRLKKDATRMKLEA
ncbi:MAG: hypothetical protein ABII72_04845 [Parcubacteria group bacterium]